MNYTDSAARTPGSKPDSSPYANHVTSGSCHSLLLKKRGWRDTNHFVVLLQGLKYSYTHQELAQSTPNILKVKSLTHVQLFATSKTVPTKLLHPWDFPGKSTGVGCHFLLQGIFPIQGSNPALPHYRQTL